MGAGEVGSGAPADQHHHLICSSCGYVVEIEHKYLEGFETGVRSDFGFAPDMHHFAIFGLCGECQMAEVADGDSP